MPGEANSLPMYIQLRYRESGVLDEIESRVSTHAGKISSTYTKAFSELDQLIRKSVQSPVTSAGALDLGLDKLRETERVHRANAAAARETATAMRAAATASGGYSAELAQAAASADRLEAEELALARAVREKVNALGLAQRELDQMATAQGRAANAAGRFNVANDNAARSSRQTNAAYSMASQQLTDIAVQMTNGTRASTALSQQLPQLGFALTGLAGSASAGTAAVGRLAGVMAGPLGVAVGLAAGSLIDLALGAGNAEEAMDDVRFASNALGDAQGILGNVLDITTGRINTQNKALLALANLSGKEKAKAGGKSADEPLDVWERAYAKVSSV